MNEVYLTDLVVIPAREALKKQFNGEKFIYVSDVHRLLSKKVIVRKVENGLYEEIVTHRIFSSLPVDMLANFAVSNIAGYVIIPSELGSRLDNSSFGYKIIKEYVTSHRSVEYNKELNDFILNANNFNSNYVNNGEKEKEECKKASMKLLSLENRGK